MGIIILIIIAGVACCAYVGKKFISHEHKQTQQISELLGETGYLKARLNQVTDYYNFETEYQDDSFNYLAIGNSLTLITSWGRGICSTQPDNDYFHLVVKSLEEKYSDVVAYPYNFSPWESAADRDSTLDLINVYLSDKLDLVTIQLGENASYLSTYEEDLESLIRCIKEKAPNAKIIIIGDWWSIEKNEMRIEATENTNCSFADLSEVIGKSEYQSVTGNLCYLDDGSTIEVPEAAATHPGDLGMEYIANKVMEAFDN